MTEKRHHAGIGCNAILDIGQTPGGTSAILHCETCPNIVAFFKVADSLSPATEQVLMDRAKNYLKERCLGEQASGKEEAIIPSSRLPR